MRVQVFFYGLPRAVEHTNFSIDKLLSGLDIVGRHACFIHRTKYENPRSGEVNAKIDFNVASECLKLDTCELLPASSSELNSVKLKALNYGDCFGDSGKSVSNLIEQLFSLKRVFNQNSHPATDLFVFLRPDLSYQGHLPIDRARKLKSNVICLPSWQSNNGFNDRFAYSACHEASFQYANRIEKVFDFCKLNGAVHSERLLQFALRTGGVGVRGISTRATRIRAGGVLKEESFTCDIWKTYLREVLGVI